MGKPIYDIESYLNEDFFILLGLFTLTFLYVLYNIEYLKIKNLETE